jgi:polyhydroxybutyrate depolymerase
MRAALLALLVALSTPALACGPDSDCVVGGRTYRIAVPDGPGPFGIVLFLHGHGSHAEDVMAYEGLRDAAVRVGAALVAPQADGPGWKLRNTPEGGVTSDEPEMADLEAILDDAAARFPLDRRRTLATGFSNGAMAVWTLACRRPDAFAGFLPISGTFWAPLPDDCLPGPVNLLHVHGTTDEVVPLAGGPVRTEMQGDVRGAVDAFRAAGGYGPPEPEDVLPGLDCRGSADPSGHRLILCLHGGGHEMDPSWIEDAYRLFVR